MLTLVHPAPPAQPSPPRSRRSAALTLTPEEARHARAALLNLCRFHGWKALTLAMKVPVKTLYRATEVRSRPTPILYLRAA